MDEEECIICYNTILSEEYAIINTIGENNNKYHVECIQDWVKTRKSDMGILTLYPVTSYTIYKDDEPQINIPIYSPYEEGMWEEMKDCCEVLCVLF